MPLNEGRLCFLRSVLKMNEIFFDRPGTLFSDGKIVKISLQSVQPTSKGEVSQDVALLVCLPEKLSELINLLQDFISHMPRNEIITKFPDNTSEFITDNSHKSEEEETSLFLGLSSNSHV